MDRVVLHSDINSCFANIECLYNPSLRGKPVSVCGSIEERHGIVLASTIEAKRYGVKTGEAIWQARQKCPELITVTPSYDRYVRFSRLARNIYADYTDRVEPFGLDEAFLDVTGHPNAVNGGAKIADEIRRRIKYELGITVSVGASFNKIFAKLGSDLKKPDAVTAISRENFKNRVWPLPVEALLYVGRSTARRLHECGINTIGELAMCREDILKNQLGKMLRADNEVLNQTVYQAWQRQIKSPRKAKTFPGDFIIWGVETVTFQTYQMKNAKIRWLASLQKTPNFVAFTELFNHFPRENQECQAIIIGILPYPHIRLFLRSPLQ